MTRAAATRPEPLPTIDEDRSVHLNSPTLHGSRKVSLSPVKMVDNVSPDVLDFIDRVRNMLSTVQNKRLFFISLSRALTLLQYDPELDITRVQENLRSTFPEILSDQVNEVVVLMKTIVGNGDVLRLDQLLVTLSLVDDTLVTVRRTDSGSRSSNMSSVTLNDNNDEPSTDTLDPGTLDPVAEPHSMRADMDHLLIASARRSHSSERTAATAGDSLFDSDASNGAVQVPQFEISSLCTDALNEAARGLERFEFGGDDASGMTSEENRLLFG